ncbi:hypothetical protein PV689_23265 [Streptomyces sp. ATCC51928]|uniref:DNA-binding protein n=1 Tax=Streptomyces caviscabies TaxID=90079 RepID=A0ABW2MDB4_9ACTN|nr:MULTISPECIES: hypothetical protein [unclassified Streptomyces]MDX3504848.1 hypothetical protein [Streptomyces sp. ATCC51928]MDX5519257.1 hypothetical protein [Streptomyces sp. DE06-01C]
MDTQQVSAPSRAPSAGVVHINIRLTDGYTIISNRLSQHRGMSLLAIGLGTHIQSLPDGRRVGVKALAAVFPESEVRIAAALRELERHGFLRRTRERGCGGRFATRTESYNHPEAAARVAVRALPETETETVTVPVTEAVPAPVPRLVPPPTAPKPPPRPLPVPCEPSAALSAEAARLLAGLHLGAPLFGLSGADVERLTPGVAAWLERGMRPEAVRAALTDDPPVPLRHPAKLLRHRLIALLPPPRPAAVPVVPLQTCDDCDRAFRSSAPGCCGGCREIRAYGGGPSLLSA